MVAWAETKSALVSDPEGWTGILPNGSFHGWTRVAIPPDSGTLMKYGVMVRKFFFGSTVS